MPLFLLVYRCSIHETTGLPANIIFGRELNLPVDLMFGRSPDQSSTTKTMQKLEDHLFGILRAVRPKTKFENDKMRTKCDQRAESGFSEVNVVWMYNHTTQG